MTSQDRKERPVYSGVLRYFPKALLEVARCSYVGNEQHNPGAPLHWDRSKSTDEADALVRHLLQAGEIDTDGVRHTAKVAWRALALLEKELESVPEVSIDVRKPGAFITNERWSVTVPARTYDEGRANATPCPCGSGRLLHNATDCAECREPRA